jgi:hypothetical protein
MQATTKEENGYAEKNHFVPVDLLIPVGMRHSPPIGSLAA